MWGKKGVKCLSLVGHEEVPHGFGLRTGDRGDIADGVRNLGRPDKLSMNYWEKPGEVSCGFLLFFSPSGGQYF